MPERHPTIQIRIRLLLLRELDVAADRVTAYFFGAPVGRLHDARPAAGHDGEAGLRQAAADLTRQKIVGLILRKSSRAEHGDAWSNEMQRSKPAYDFPENSQRPH